MFPEPDPLRKRKSHKAKKVHGHYAKVLREKSERRKEIRERKKVRLNRTIQTTLEEEENGKNNR